MKALVVTWFNMPLTATDLGGIHRRTSIFLRVLHRLGAEITVLAVVKPQQIEAVGSLDALSESQSAFWGVPLRMALAPRRPWVQTRWTHYGAGVLDGGLQPHFAPFAGAEVADAVAPYLDADPDLVFAHRLQGIMPILRSGRRPRRLVLDLDDVEHKVVFRQAFSQPRYPGKAVKLLHVPAMLRLERQAVAASQLTFVCSERDRAYLRRMGFGDTVRVVPNAVKLPADPPGLCRAPTVLFLGDKLYDPNLFAAERFATRIWPRVHAAMPSARLLIAGRASERLSPAAQSAPGVEYLGFVDDLAALYARTRVVGCPIMTGGGTRLKLVEAAGFARPMVSTRIGAEGLDFVDGAQILLRDDDSGFADACLALLRDDAMCERLGAAARATMAAKYDVRGLEDRVAAMLEALPAR